MTDKQPSPPPLRPFPPGLGRPEIAPGAEREYFLSVVRRLLHPFRRKAS